MDRIKHFEQGRYILLLRKLSFTTTGQADRLDDDAVNEVHLRANADDEELTATQQEDIIHTAQQKQSR